MSKLNVKQLDKQIRDLNKSATLLKRELNRLYRMLDRDLSPRKHREVEIEINFLERRISSMQAVVQRFADDGFSFI